MILRACFIAIMFGLMFYGLGYLATFTPFFKDKERVRRIIKKAVLVFIASVLTVLVMGFIIAVDHTV